MTIPAKPTEKEPTDMLEGMGKETAELMRYGITWSGYENEPLLTAMPDGYWTPWHTAANALVAKDAKIERLMVENKRLWGLVDELDEANLVIAQQHNALAAKDEIARHHGNHILKLENEAVEAEAALATKDAEIAGLKEQLHIKSTLFHDCVLNLKDAEGRGILLASVIAQNIFGTADADVYGATETRDMIVKKLRDARPALAAKGK